MLGRPTDPLTEPGFRYAVGEDLGPSDAHHREVAVACLKVEDFKRRS
jgi:hypothetical protein